MKILCVTSEVYKTDPLLQALRSLKHDVEVCRGVLPALSLLSTAPFDFMFVLENMPQYPSSVLGDFAKKHHIPFAYISWEYVATTAQPIINSRVPNIFAAVDDDVTPVVVATPSVVDVIPQVVEDCVSYWERTWTAKPTGVYAGT